MKNFFMLTFLTVFMGGFICPSDANSGAERSGVLERVILAAVEQMDFANIPLLGSDESPLHFFVQRCEGKVEVFFRTDLEPKKNHVVPDALLRQEYERQHPGVPFEQFQLSLEALYPITGR